MSNRVVPLRRIRIHKQRGFGTWSAYCPCCWNEGAHAEICIANDMLTFEQARNWAVGHIAIEHRMGQN